MDAEAGPQGGATTTRLAGVAPAAWDDGDRGGGGSSQRATVG